MITTTIASLIRYKFRRQTTKLNLKVPRATNIVILIDVVSLDIFQDTIKEMLSLAKNYDKALEEEDKMTPEQLAIKNVGKQDPKRHLEEKVDVMMTTNIVQCLGAMLDAVIFK